LKTTDLINANVITKEREALPCELCLEGKQKCHLISELCWKLKQQIKGWKLISQILT
jgi:hypothetical protein